MFDHRCYPRFKEEANVNVKILSPTESPVIENKLFSYHSIDVSSSGIQLSVDTDITVGTLLQVDISFNHLIETYHHVGHVVWSRGEIAHDIDAQLYRNIGIKFISCTQREYKLWADAVSTLIKKHREFHPFYQNQITTETLR